MRGNTLNILRDEALFKRKRKFENLPCSFFAVLTLKIYRESLYKKENRGTPYFSLVPLTRSVFFIDKVSNLLTAAVVNDWQN
jgi:hypothetical protein